MKNSHTDTATFLPLFILASVLLAATIPAGADALAEPALPAVDFCYSPPWWQTAICLPDDPDKALVGREGQLLYDFDGGGPSTPDSSFAKAMKGQLLNRNFFVSLQPEIVGGAKWVRQQTVSARVPIVQTWKDAEGVSVLEEAFVDTSRRGQIEGGRVPERRVVVLVTLKNAMSSTATRQPALRIQSAEPVSSILGDGSVTAGPGTRVSASVRLESCTPGVSNSFLLRLQAMTLKPGESQQVAFTVDRHSRKPVSVLSVKQARQLRDAAIQWWEEKAGLPFDTIQVPDPGIQGILESSIRNIWQAREIQKGQLSFNVGPTVYHGLWVADGSFLLEAAALVNRAQDARAGIEYLLSNQKPDGSFEMAANYWKENGMVLWTATRYAFLTQDKAWLRGHWPALQRVVKAIQNLRAEASKDPQALNYRLLPGGFVDGGISNRPLLKPEFSNSYWCLGGLKAAIAAARWLGDEESAAAWQKEYDDFYAVLRKAMERDTFKDAHGNSYVPIMMANANQRAKGECYIPQKAQWAFCHAVYPGQLFPENDPMVEGQLAMLRATKFHGMVFDTGIINGIWTYFASFYAHALLWEGGHRDEASEMLYSFANHACPTRVWREEALGTNEVGDMPHNWASAEFIRLVTHLVELDRGEELHLLEGLPPQWLAPGMTIRLNGVATPFGPLHLTVQVRKDGKTAVLQVNPLGADCKAVVVHLPDGSKRTLNPNQGGELVFNIRSGS